MLPRYNHDDHTQLVIHHQEHLTQALT